MKKIIFFVIVIIISLFIYINVSASSYDVVIPDAAIRVRVVANSNSLYDQSMKMKVKEYIEKELSVKLLDIDNIDSARSIINNEVNGISNAIKSMFDKYNYNSDFVIHFGDNYFPIKRYKGVNYSAGTYESLVIVIGDGKGDNWWCVLFPPLCLLEAENNNTDDVEYQFFVKRMLDKVFS